IPAEAGDGRRWLHTSPEFPMKRLLASGSGDIYQICPVFRDGEQGRWHNPEFTLLEWYRLGMEEQALAMEVCELVAELAREAEGPLANLESEPAVISYREAYRRHAGVDPFEDETGAIAEAAIRVTGTGGPLDWGRNDWLDLLGSLKVYPALGHGRPAVVTEFPADQAALARVHPGSPPTAARFEVVLGGVEIANGFHELSDPEEQLRRFRVETEERQGQGLPPVPWDPQLISALEAGLPDCAGVALGLDRLIALVLGCDGIGPVTAFPWDRA
ncbi:EF-P lysine aminoacylase EpmA, partial [Natronospira sp.]